MFWLAGACAVSHVSNFWPCLIANFVKVIILLCNNIVAEENFEKSELER